MKAGEDLGFTHRYVPAASADSKVLLLLLHGTGGTESDLIPLGQQLLPGAALLSPRGRVLENGMPRFFRRLAEGVFDQEDLKRRTAELTQFIIDARERYELQESKTCAVGYSNGANIAGSVLLTCPDPLDGAILFRPMVPFVPQAQPKLRGRSVLLLAGRRDAIAAPEQTSELAAMLQAAGAAVAVHWHPGGHELGQDDIDAAKRWLADWNADT